jgi:polyphosphate kinase
VPLKRSSGSLKKDGTVPRRHYFVWLEQLIAANLERLFPGLKVIEAHPFYIIRNADMTIQN